MKKHYEFTNSEEAYAVIMNPNTGEILATSVFTKKKIIIETQSFKVR